MWIILHIERAVLCVKTTAKEVLELKRRYLPTQSLCYPRRKPSPDTRSFLGGLQLVAQDTRSQPPRCAYFSSVCGSAGCIV